ncbi:Fimbrial anchor (Mannose-resistance fimbriae), MrfB protein [Edwardsiella anguillarum]|uniref:fimbrial protein n=1 Tax=Edwardsiella TaxID=635 RepID=UPI00045CC45A|nr:fimbrial protein [Edwardsiella anguillarum]GAJ66132.1 fimbrial anchor (mannose-resistance fimbriae), MrfB protein [Edwardsiella piscicida]BET81286.1 Fimbrial anchor (Mannose-resistance fimbriae), MrfB protein [Edwardsiella anguillarum]BET84713.1 Fimbrial anchor (Mannose-resistance fimbriae), MrfB protein [Edwardsiella anguillarum]BET88078.1 Fimbrial anchor (Mannose-resistance fimbriae), MrfB protein [Edwardsiella anguillarum]BET91369.1 Fimbrial anchor (Mannose-resistance fimbriae), MrfB pro
MSGRVFYLAISTQGLSGGGMRYCGFTIVVLYLLALPAISRASDLGTGYVRMQGSIIDTPCSIAVESRDQIINMSVVPVAQIMRDSYGPTRSFRIRLEHCDLARDNPNQPDWNTFRVTFDGAATHHDLFAVSGEGRGVGLQIADEADNLAIPGVKMPAGNLHPGSNMLYYTMRLVTNHKKLQAGAYRTSIRFKLDYY